MSVCVYYLGVNFSLIDEMDDLNELMAARNDLLFCFPC